MGLFKKNKFKDVNLMDLVPVKKYEYEKKANDLINVLVPKFTDRILGKYLQPKLKDKYIVAELDKFGSSAWVEIDGEKTIYDISKVLENKFGKEIQPVYDRVGIFFSNLYKNGFIYFNEFIEGKNNGKSISKH